MYAVSGQKNHSHKTVKVIWNIRISMISRCPVTNSRPPIIWINLCSHVHRITWDALHNLMVRKFFILFFFKSFSNNLTHVSLCLWYGFCMCIMYQRVSMYYDVMILNTHKFILLANFTLEITNKRSVVRTDVYYCVWVWPKMFGQNRFNLENYTE